MQSSVLGNGTYVWKAMFSSDTGGAGAKCVPITIMLYSWIARASATCAAYTCAASLAGSEFVFQQADRCALRTSIRLARTV
eukprot:scaffold95256_cov31-Tisochrysis_lutea.AAC.3